MDLDREIRDHILAYLAGTLEFDAFEAWFISEAWDDRTPLAMSVDLLLAERAGRDSAAFGEELHSLVATIELGEPATIVSSAANETVERSSALAGNETITRDLAFADS